MLYISVKSMIVLTPDVKVVVECLTKSILKFTRERQKTY